MSLFGNTFYERVETILKIEGIKKVQFYTDLGLSKTTVLYWKNKTEPSLQSAFAVAKYLDVSLDWLITGNDSNDYTDDYSAFHIVDRIETILQEETKISSKTPNDTFYLPLHGCIKSYQLNMWRYGIQTPKLQELIKVADNLRVSVQFLITGNNISSEEKAKEMYSKYTELDNLYKSYNLLPDSDRKTVRDVSYSLFIRNIYHRDLENNNKQVDIDFDPYEDPNYKGE